jgi:hypothetical protein
MKYQNSTEGKINLVAKQVAIVVVSCKKYSDVWPIFYRQLELNWPNCPFKIYLVSDDPGFNPKYKNTENLFLSLDDGWGKNLLDAIDRIPEDYVLYMAEDYLLKSIVNTKDISDAIDSAILMDANYLLMSGCIEPDNRINGHFGVLNRGREYRTSVYFSLFKKAVLSDLLNPSESAWEFETEGAVRSNRFDGFYVTYTNCFEIIGPHSAVIKGKWTREAIKELKSLGYKTEDFVRPVFSMTESIQSHLKRKVSKILRNLIPRRFRLFWVRIKNGRFNFA